MADLYSTAIGAISQMLQKQGQTEASAYNATAPDDMLKAQLNSDKIAADAAHKLMADPAQPIEKKAAALEAYQTYTKRIDSNPLTLQKKNDDTAAAQTQAALAKAGVTPGQGAPAGPADPLMGFVNQQAAAPTGPPPLTAQAIMSQVGAPIVAGSPFLRAPSLSPAQAGAPTMGGQVFIDPRAAMAMIPNAAGVGKVTLPAAPQQAPQAAQPLRQMLDKNALLAPLAEAMAPAAPQDTADRPWQRMQAFLQGAAGGVARAGADASIGQLIAGIGAGANAGFVNEKEKQKLEDQTYQNQLRQAKTELAKQGFQIDLKNVDTGDLNADRIWQTGENNRKIQFDNMQSGDQRKVQQILENVGIAKFNAGEANSTNRARAQVGISALESGASAVNSSTAKQDQANLITVGQKGQEQRIDTMLSQIGVDTKTSNTNPHVGTARGTAAAILAHNPDAALGSTAQEIVDAGLGKEFLAPNKTDLPAIATAKANALRAINTAKKPADAQAAVQTIAQMLNGNHVAAHAWLKAHPTLPSAGLIVKYANDPNPAS